MSGWTSQDWRIGNGLPSALYNGAYSGAERLLADCARAYLAAAYLIDVETDLSRALKTWSKPHVYELFPVYWRLAYHYRRCVEDYQLALPMESWADILTPEARKVAQWWEWFHDEAKRLQENMNFVRAICQTAMRTDTETGDSAAEYLSATLDYRYGCGGN